MKLAVLYSGGKDSSLALHRVLEAGHEVRCLLNIVSENRDSFMFHKQDLELYRVQVDRIGIPLISVETKGEKEKELDDLRELIGKVKDEVEGVVVGGIASSYQGTRVKKICEEMGLEFVAPILDIDSVELWEELIREGFEVVMIKIACEGISKDWLGRVIDSEALEELKELSKKYKFRLDFEGGEAESCVLNCPEYSSRIDIEFDVESEGKYRHFMKDIRVK